MEKQVKKPPLGIIPRPIWLERRKREIMEAITRYNHAKMNVPCEWIKEYFEIDTEINRT